MQTKLTDNIMEGYYQAHPQGKELLKLDLAEYIRLHEAELKQAMLEQFREQTDQTPVTKIEKDK